MIKSELIKKVAEENRLKHADAERVVSTIFDHIVNALAEGNRVELRGFGILTVRTRKARKARNPKTGAPVFIAEKKVPFFKAGKDIQDALNNR